MTREDLDREIELTLARNRAAIERFDAHRRKFEPLMVIHTITTERVFRELREAIRQRR